MVLKHILSRIEDGYGFEFDQWGRTTSRMSGGVTHEWLDAADFQTGATTSDGYQESYAYGVDGLLASTVHSGTSGTTFTAHSLVVGGNEVAEWILNEDGVTTPTLERWNYYFTGGLDSLQGATRKIGDADAKEYLFVRDHLGSIVLTLEIDSELVGGYEEPPDPEGLMMSGNGNSAPYDPEEGMLVSLSEGGELVIGQDSNLLLDDGSTTATLFGLDGAILTFDATGGAMRAMVPGGGVLLKDADSLTMTGEGGELLIEGGSGGVGGGMMSMGGGSYGEERMFFARAIEQVEYEPYGTPTIHACDEWGGAWRTTTSSYSEREGQPVDSHLSAIESENFSTQAGKGYDSAALSSIGLKFLFTGRSWHAATEQYYYRARWYEPEAGRFLSRDPIGYSGGVSQYMYVGGNPILLRDPTGLEPYSFADDNGSIFGKIWTLPNSLLGVTLGLLGEILGTFSYPFTDAPFPTIGFGNNAMEFYNNPLMFDAAITLGNTINYQSGYGPDTLMISSYTDLPIVLGRHEKVHTHDYERLGILFLPVYLLNGGPSGTNLYEIRADMAGYEQFLKWQMWDRENPFLNSDGGAEHVYDLY